MNEKSFGLWVNISSLIVSVLALWLTSWLVASYLILVCILLALGYWTFRFWKDRQAYRSRFQKERQAYRRLLSSFSHVHQLPHELRDILVSEKLFEIYRHPEDHEVILISSALKVLDISANLFNQIVGVPCYANLMVPYSENSENSVKLRAVLWSTNTPPDRYEKTPVTEIPIGLGIAGRAFLEQQVKIVNNIETHRHFLIVSDKETVAYKSVISCPYRVNGTPAGVVNIDCEKKDAFKPEEVKFLIQAAADTLALVYQLFEGIKEIHYETKNKLDQMNKQSIISEG